MTVCQQEAIKAAKAGAAPQQLPLGPLTAINQDARAGCFNEKGRMVAFRGRNARRGPEKCQGEHGCQCPETAPLPDSTSTACTVDSLTAPNATRAAARTGP